MEIKSQILTSIKDLCIDIEFELGLSENQQVKNFKNIRQIERFLEMLNEEYSENIKSNNLNALINELISLKEQYINLKSEISEDDLKKVFLMLRKRELHPAGYFDKAKRFYLYDSELVEVGLPSIKYKYRQMNAARTSTFVRAVAEKYKCNNLLELIDCFERA
ncbi:hypothetical protein [Phocoenobacter skyensis]|uniref:Uncharacterized protein n=1 Tax=Phocoenobacter skyensis TaxID=97481 RepID=A0A1H7XJI4_9PAST|nr:hypothetical protein [Pasteurella skyensis]MDP8184388.1 hypothetical protein [Pasteurella skyensis]QLB22609.1 hypothetical protein A6B44_05070 [Pasteurella skyensis]SEM33921.1 hypothetical protein SAMN05444853_1136 [Pasteurella skyensis]